jgi:hypothetical protein
MPVDLSVDGPVRESEPVALLVDVGSCRQEAAEFLQSVLLDGQVDSPAPGRADGKRSPQADHFWRSRDWPFSQA